MDQHAQLGFKLELAARVRAGELTHCACFVVRGCGHRVLLTDVEDFSFRNGNFHVGVLPGALDNTRNTSSCSGDAGLVAAIDEGRVVRASQRVNDDVRQWRPVGRPCLQIDRGGKESAPASV